MMNLKKMLLIVVICVISNVLNAQKKDSTKKESETPKETTDGGIEVKYFNAYNFDFGGLGKDNYLGNFNVFIPKMIEGDNKYRMGLNAGFLKINYSNGGDSINQTKYINQNVLIKPLDPITIGTRYLNQFNKLAITSKNTSYSLYAQPLFYMPFLSSTKEGEFDWYFHAHFELFVDKWTSSATLTNLQQDTLTMNANTVNGVYSLINKFPKTIETSVNLSSTQTNLSGYFGAGITVKSEPVKNKVKIFEQFTVGRILSYVNPFINNNTFLLDFNSTNDKKPFFLNRLELQYQLNDKLDAIIGSNIRSKGLDEAPKYAIYVGANLGIDGLIKLLTPSKDSEKK